MNKKKQNIIYNVMQTMDVSKRRESRDILNLVFSKRSWSRNKREYSVTIRRLQSPRNGKSRQWRVITFWQIERS